MRGIERLLAAMALMAALGGTAAVARHLAGGGTDAQPVSLAAPPQQHVHAPRPVWAPLPARVRTLSRPALAAAPAASAPRSSPSVVRRIVVPRVAPMQPPSPTPAAKPDLPAPAPAPAPAPLAAAPEPPRVLASTVPQETVAAGESDVEGDGHHGGHGHQDGHQDDQDDQGGQDDQGDNGHGDHGHHGDPSDD